MSDIMSESVELSEHGSKPLVKVYTPRRLHNLFHRFEKRTIYQRQMLPEERPAALRWVPMPVLERLIGWNLIIKAYKPR
jgi:hypothetical protein